jgi:hypothetical protein
MKYPDLYTSRFWRAVHPVDRAQLLLVCEGVKPGTVVYWHTNIPGICKRTGLRYVRHGKGVTIGRTIPQITSDRSNGRFLGYPSCCIDTYIRGKDDFPSSREEHFYRPPSFTPCRKNCKHAMKLLRLWMETMRACDPEAAEALRKFNS